MFEVINNVKVTFCIAQEDHFPNLTTQKKEHLNDSVLKCTK